jgi:hypothetical protein
MRAMFAAKRARPDILLPVVFLASRVTKATEEDETKFLRVLQYLNSTRDLRLRLSPGTIIQLHAFIDASFAVHPDSRSHTGIVITIGCGALYVKSMFQKLVSKSSTEAELIGLSDTIGQVIWTRNFLEAMGYSIEPATVYQDNLSTIAMVHNGAPTSHRTRHINIRFFFTKDLEERKEIRLEHCPSEGMLADFFTKPLQGGLFLRLRDRILGYTH